MAEDDPFRLETRNGLALQYYMQGRLTEAEALSRDILAIRRKSLPADDPSIGDAMGQLSLVLLLLFAAYRLNPLCLKLSPVALFFLALYSYCKRFTAFAHVVLGLCLAAAPIGAWIAIRGEVSLPPIILGAAVLFWVAGFDILYALQDLEFDRSAGLHSIPVTLGVNGSLWLARLFSAIMILLLLWLRIALDMGTPFLCGIGATSLLLFYEHLLLKDGDLGKLNLAFFTMNGYVSIIILIATFAEIFIPGGGR